MYKLKEKREKRATEKGLKPYVTKEQYTLMDKNSKSYYRKNKDKIKIE